MVNSRGGTFTPSQSQQTIVTGISHSPHGSHAYSAGASPSTSSPTGINSATKVVVAQVYLLLSTIKEDKDRTKWEQQTEQLRKLIDENGMEVFQKYFSRLVVGSAPHIFGSRPVANPSNYTLLVSEFQKLSTELNQAAKIAEAVATANEDVFRDFNLSVFMEHFKLDALDKTNLALAFKSGTRSDLKTKADAILSANYRQFIEILSLRNPIHNDIPSSILTAIIDRFIQEHPPSFDSNAKVELLDAIDMRYRESGTSPPSDVISALSLVHLLNNRNRLVQLIQRVGSNFTSSEDECRNYLRSSSQMTLDEEQVAAAILYTIISRTRTFNPSVLVASLRKEVSSDFRWPQVIAEFDLPGIRVTPDQFLKLYESLKPLAFNDSVDIQNLWGGNWRNSETQLSFLTAFASLTPDQLDATRIPNLLASFSLEDFANADPEVQNRAAFAIRHPLVSVAALQAMFHVALKDPLASDTPEAKRLFQDVVIPNMDIFMVSASSVPRPWSDLANDTMQNLFDRFVNKSSTNFDFVLGGLWVKDKTYVAQRLIDFHSRFPLDLPKILEHALQHDWLTELVAMLNGFGLDLAALAHAKGELDVNIWAQLHVTRKAELSQSLVTFLSIKAQHELDLQRNGQPISFMLPVKTVSALLDVCSTSLPEAPTRDLIIVQRACITAYPRLINYGQGFDDIIDLNGKESNLLPPSANEQMEQHYKSMYSDELQVRQVVEKLSEYKRSRDPADQEVFACMIHGLFDEYSLYSTYPLEALATTAVLFGGIISSNLISDLPLEIGLGMILEAVRDHSPEQSMYKFGLQALMQLFSRLREWAAFCRQLLQVPQLQGTEAWNKAEEVVRDHQEEITRNGIDDAAVHQLINGGSLTNGHLDELEQVEPSAPPFNSLHVDSPLSIVNYNDPDEQTREQIQFVLNNITIENLGEKFDDLKTKVDERNQKWFAQHLVEARAKMQPNYHQLYLDLVKLFGTKSLWTEILRETYICAFRSLNSESTMQSAVERSHLKNLGVWLGSLTLARDKPIKHRNIAFKQLLLEAYDTQRLIVVIPFVCKVLSQGKYSTVFKPPNPWIIDIMECLMELYHTVDLKLNQKFEIEVLCGDLELDLKEIQPSNVLMNRVSQIEEAADAMAPDVVDRFDNMTLNGMGVNNERFSSQEITSSIPDLGPLLIYPPTNDMVNQQQLQQIVRSAITRAVHEIISPVVERSVTIAAISTAQMVHKDFATEPNEARVRAAAINMVKRTAGSLALVTSKEPLRASMTNYIRQLSLELPSGLPEGTIIMCVNSNLDLACSQVEKKAEERAVPEIEDMIEAELEARRHHRVNRPDDPYYDPSLSRWSWTIPNPYKLQPNMSGLNVDQMAIYDEFSRLPRLPSLTGPNHAASASDATRSIANEVLHDQYSALPNMTTPAEPAARPQLNNQQSSYAPALGTMTNGRVASADPRAELDRVVSMLSELERVAVEAPEKNMADLPRPHPITDVLDSLFSTIIRGQNTYENQDLHILDIICNKLFSGLDDELFVECLVHVLENACRISGRLSHRVMTSIMNQEPERLLQLPLATALVRAEFVEWQRIDSAASKAIGARKEGSLEFLSSLLDAVLLNDRPVALFADFAKSLEVSWQWIDEEPSLEAGQELKQKLSVSGRHLLSERTTDDQVIARQAQMEYVFDEWVHLSNNPNASSKSLSNFVSQLHNKQVINSKDDLCVFLRAAIDSCVAAFEVQLQNNAMLVDAYIPIDSLARLIITLVKSPQREGEVKKDKAAFLEMVTSVIVLVLNHHHVMRGERFNQRVFFRLFSSILVEFSSAYGDLTAEERRDIILDFAKLLLTMRPSYFPGFLFSWLTLLTHRAFLPPLMALPAQAGWEPLADIVECLVSYVAELLKPTQITQAGKEIYRGLVKLLVLLQHDFPEFVAAYHSKLTANIPAHCVQLHNIILNANPMPFAKIPDPLQPGLKVDRIEEIRDSPEIMNDVEAQLRQSGLFDILEQALQSGPSEDAVAQIAHAIQQPPQRQSGFGFVPINVDHKLIESLVVYVGMHAIARASQNGSPTFVSSAPDAELVSMLVHELQPEARYFLVNSMVNQLRFPNSHTHYYSQAILEIFGTELNDQEESDIREQVVRVLLERIVGQWPQPWGLILTVQELVKNEKYMFFELPFIKATPEVANRFLSLASQ